MQNKHLTYYTYITVWIEPKDNSNINHLRGYELFEHLNFVTFLSENLGESFL